MNFFYNPPPIPLHRRLIPLFCIAMFCSSQLWAAPYCRDSGLVDIPTGKVIEHGIFNLGTYFAFRNAGELPRDEAALQLDFGLFDRVEIGLTSVRHNQQSFLLGNFKVLLLREAGIVPNVAVGLENIGDSIEGGLNDTERYERQSAFLAVSKAIHSTEPPSYHRTYRYWESPLCRRYRHEPGLERCVLRYQ